VSTVRTILVVNSGSEEGASALRFATGLALNRHARLVVITVVPLVLVYTPDVTSAAVGAQTERRMLRHHQQSVSDIPHEIGVQSRVSHGSPGRKILEACASCHCDVLVLPEPRRRGVLDRSTRRRLLKIARASNVSVLLAGSSAVRESGGIDVNAFRQLPLSGPAGPAGRHRAEQQALTERRSSRAASYG
jgi:nucleotide-binding universal stress UspA family protein